MKKLLFALLVVSLAACSKQAVTLEGSLTLGTGRIDDPPLANQSVLLIPDSLVGKSLEQYRQGYKQEIARLEQANLAVGNLLDSLQTVFKKTGDKKIEERYRAVADSGAKLKRELENYRASIFVFIAKELSKQASAEVKTDNQGNFKFQSLVEGKYVVLAGYTSQKRSGLLVKPVELKPGANKIVLNFRDADPILTYAPEE
ncbi:MAG: carboxypeptidase-like regulatory domain-containing protein [Chloroherpetonaceae bacterium]|nr:carboxypeptidase-like regulatory domain-containing protein [Chloroherpetonaceae bacterium]MDW8436798.1 carboxypeptidase-like regulatory domain-containing protein [Chloroherpetonaceae bacterium]